MDRQYSKNKKAIYLFIHSALWNNQQQNLVISYTWRSSLWFGSHFLNSTKDPLCPDPIMERWLLMCMPCTENATGQDKQPGSSQSSHSHPQHLCMDNSVMTTDHSNTLNIELTPSSPFILPRVSQGQSVFMFVFNVIIYYFMYFMYYERVFCSHACLCTPCIPGDHRRRTL